MNEESMRTFHAYTLLSDAGRAEFDKVHAEYTKAPIADKMEVDKTCREIFEKSNKLQSGPIKGGCPYCGR